MEMDGLSDAILRPWLQHTEVDKQMASELNSLQQSTARVFPHKAAGFQGDSVLDSKPQYLSEYEEETFVGASEHWMELSVADVQEEKDETKQDWEDSQDSLLDSPSILSLTDTSGVGVDSYPEYDQREADRIRFFKSKRRKERKVMGGGFQRPIYHPNMRSAIYSDWKAGKLKTKSGNNVVKDESPLRLEPVQVYTQRPATTNLIKRRIDNNELDNKEINSILNLTRPNTCQAGVNCVSPNQETTISVLSSRGNALASLPRSPIEKIRSNDNVLLLKSPVEKIRPFQEVRNTNIGGNTSENSSKLALTIPDRTSRPNTSSALKKLEISASKGTVSKALRDQLLTTSGAFSLFASPLSPIKTDMLDSRKTLEKTLAAARQTKQLLEDDNTWDVLKTPGFVETVGISNFYQSVNSYQHPFTNKHDNMVKNRDLTNCVKSDDMKVWCNDTIRNGRKMFDSGGGGFHYS